MKPEVAKQWVKALRSGKYKQGVGALKQQYFRGGIHHCCLGVLCELYNENMQKQKKKTLKETTADYLFVIDDAVDVLPESVKRWAGMNTNRGIMKIDPQQEKGDNIYYRESLAEMNDLGDSFKKIAKTIEKHVDDL